MDKNEDRCSQAELGRRWKISRQMVGKYAEKGLKVGEDGKYSWSEADAWRHRYVASTRSGSYRFRESAKRAQTKKACELPTGAPSGGSGDDLSDYDAARLDIRSAIRTCGLSLMVVCCEKKGDLEARLRTLMEIDGYLSRWDELNGLKLLAVLQAFDFEDFSSDVQRLAKRIQVDVNTKFAEMRKRDISMPRGK